MNRTAKTIATLDMSFAPLLRRRFGHGHETWICGPFTRFSSRRYWMTSSWWRFTQPARVTIKIRTGRASNMDRVYLYRPPPRPLEPSADFSDSTVHQFWRASARRSSPAAPDSRISGSLERSARASLERGIFQSKRGGDWSPWGSWGVLRRR